MEDGPLSCLMQYIFLRYSLKQSLSLSNWFGVLSRAGSLALLLGTKFEPIEGVMMILKRLLDKPEAFC